MTAVAEGWRVVLQRRGGTWRVGRLLGEGGQGSVHELVPEAPDGQPLALKWYRAQSAQPAQRAALAALTARPAPSEGFLWPLELVDGDGGAFGYVMKLRPPGYVPLADLLTGRADVGFGTVARLAMGLADCFLQLHAEGLCYRDISLGNVFFEPATGRPLVCDNDNVGVEGQEPARVLGTSRFMAPEIVRGEAQPSSATDLYSLAVLIFYLLMVHHPLQGRRELDFACLDREAETELFGRSPRFVFDPVDTSNAPDPLAHAAVLRYWPIYPSYIRSEFVRAFTLGLTDPRARVREGVWRSRMSRLLDGVVVCACGRENFTDDGVAGICWSCNQPIAPPVRLQVGDRTLVLNATTEVTRHLLVRDYDYATVVGRVEQHPDRPEVWGLRNVSLTPWELTLEDGETHTVEPGRAMGLVAGARIGFGAVSGTLLV
jgi:DNA-binding helix-hairpin-helix protein with protein kinase domain